MVSEKNIINEIRKKKLFTEEKIEAIEKMMKRSGKNLDELVYSQKVLNPEEYLKLKAELMKVPHRIFDLKEEIPKDILNLVQEETAKNYQVIPFDLKDGQIYLGAVNPEDAKLESALKFISDRNNVNVKVFLISPEDFSRLVDQYRDFAEEVQEAIKSFRTSKPQEEKRYTPLESSHIVSSEDAPIIRLVAGFIRRAVKMNASDIHIEPLSDKLRIRFRVEGDLGTAAYLPLDMASPIISRIKILSNLKIDETRIPQDGRFRSSIDQKEVDFRVSTFPTSVGEKAAIRVLDPNIGLRDLKELGMNDYHEAIINESIKKPYGMILIAGPTGSGKTTTLYAILRLLNTDEVNILSLEDPVEYRIDGINQSQVMPEIGYSFASGLREAVRQDPDIVLVGEIRDKETAELAVHAALTGHLLFSTLHTNDSIGVIPRLLDMGIENYLLPPTLILSVAQRLVRKLCPYCRVQKEPQGEVLAAIKAIVSDISQEVRNHYGVKEPYKVYSSPGCDRCGRRGSIGRIGIYELFQSTPQLEEIILSKPNETVLKAEAKRQKMLTLRQDGVIKALNGIVAVEEVLRETV